MATTSPFRPSGFTKPGIDIQSADPLDVALVPLPFTLNIRIPGRWEKVATFLIALCTIPIVDKSFFSAFPHSLNMGTWNNWMASLIICTIGVGLPYIMGEFRTTFFYYQSQLTITPSGILKQRQRAAPLFISWESVRHWTVQKQANMLVHTLSSDEIAISWSEGKGYFGATNAPGGCKGRRAEYQTRARLLHGMITYYGNITPRM